MPNSNSIRGRLGFLFLAFVMLVSISVGATYWGIETQKQDALIINMAGRQRMLIQLMTRLAIEHRYGDNYDEMNELTAAIITFEQTLFAIRFGGQTPYLEDSIVELPPAQNEHVQSQLDQVQISWDAFRSALDQIVAHPQTDVELEDALQSVEALSPVLVEQADGVVRLYEAESTQKVVRLRNLQIGFFVSALIFLGIGIQVIQKSVLHPLKLLGTRAERIGSGDLKSPGGISNPAEIALLDQTLDTMQAHLRDSQLELLSWAETLEERVDQRTRILDALYEISRDISSRLDVQFVLDSVTEKARQLLNGEIATLCLLNEQDKSLVIKAHSGPKNAVIEAITTTQYGLANQILSRKEARLCQHGDCDAACGILADTYRASHLVAPLWVEDQVIGVLCVGSTEPQVFSDDAIQLLAKLASSAAIALENARLYAQAERAATLEERQRIAADMHDGVGQTISKLGLDIDLAEKYLEGEQLEMVRDQLTSARDSIDSASDDVRGAIAHLLDDSPIHQNLQSQVESIIHDLQSQAINGNSLNWYNSIDEPVTLHRGDTEQVLRIAGEALNNAYRHSGATSTDIYLKLINSDYVLTIKDNGKGFDPHNIPDDGGKHFGLKIMQARATHLGGDLRVDSTPGEGTRIILRWPVSSPSRKTTS